MSRPPLAEWIALSPDGQRVAYSAPGEGGLKIVIANLEPPGAKRIIEVEPAHEAAATKNHPPAPLRFLRWATAHRLVFAPVARVVPLPPVTDKHGRQVPNPDGPAIHAPVFAVDADGNQRATVIDAAYFQETPADARTSLADLLRTTQQLTAARNEAVGWRMPHLDILGFLPRDREQLIIQTRGGHSVPMQHLVDIRTGTVREFGSDWPMPPGDPHIYDAFRLKVVGERRAGPRPTIAWHDEMLAKTQRELDAKFPRRVVEILDWSDARSRLLFRVTGGTDPGRLFIYHRPEDVVVEFLSRTPWLDAAKLNETRYFEFAASDGARLSGYLTWPAKPRLAPPPLLLVFPDDTTAAAARPAFDPEAQIYADCGFAVARLNHRAVVETKPAGAAPTRTPLDRLAAADARAAIDWLATRNPPRAIDRQRVAALGRDAGGYFALRASQLEPSLFRGVIALDAPGDAPLPLQAPAAPDQPGGVNGPPSSTLQHVEALVRPLLLGLTPGRSAATDTSTAELRARLQALGRPADYLELDPGLDPARPAARTAAYRKIEHFLDLHVLDAAVKPGPGKEVR